MISCCSSFATGQPAGASRPEFRGRPGLNPLRHRQVLDLPQRQLDQLRAIATDLGLEQRRQQRLDMGFARPPADPTIYPFLDQSFRGADEAKIVTELDEADFEEQLRWAREAKARADQLLVSLHTHEQGATPLDPPAFVVDFAHRMIGAGADVVVMHGPHQLRGIELYRGKPIFHSLGNLFGQNELTYVLPADTYRRFGADPDDLPSQAFEARSQGGTASFPAYSQYWESVVPICRFEQGALVEIEIVPIELGFGQPVHRRGRPRVATGDQAGRILERFKGLCETYGTELVIQAERASVCL
jgi:poly-gamma-glutamate synthesis protein (capsule biosynthesis protein)